MTHTHTHTHTHARTQADTHTHADTHMVGSIVRYNRATVVRRTCRWKSVLTTMRKGAQAHRQQTRHHKGCGQPTLQALGRAVAWYRVDAGVNIADNRPCTFKSLCITQFW